MTNAAVYSNEWEGARGETNTLPSEHEHDEMSVPTASYFRRESAPSIEAEVSPTREGRATDASRLTFPVQMMIGAIVMTVTIVGGIRYYADELDKSISAQASDLRDIRTRMEMQTQVDIARNEARIAEMKSQNEAINDLRRITQMLQIQYSELSKKVR